MRTPSDQSRFGCVACPALHREPLTRRLVAIYRAAAAGVPATRAPPTSRATRRPILRPMWLRDAAPLARAVAVMSLWVAAAPAKCQPSSPSTTREPTGAAFTLRSANSVSACSVTQDGSCITDGSGADANYNDNERCTFSVTRDTALYAWRFNTEQGFDFLSISGGGPRFSGMQGPEGVSVPAGANVTWSSDYSNTGRGFLVCDGTPPPTPPTASPTSAPTVFSGDLSSRGLTTAAIRGLLPFPPSATTIDLSDNHITSIPSGAFDSLSALTELNLNSNNITSIPSGAFDSLSALTQLGLWSNRISSIPSGAFDSLSVLTVLNLNSNRISLSLIHI